MDPCSKLGLNVKINDALHTPRGYEKINLTNGGLWEEQGNPLKQVWNGWQGKKRRLAWVFIEVRMWSQGESSRTGAVLGVLVNLLPAPRCGAQGERWEARLSSCPRNNKKWSQPSHYCSSILTFHDLDSFLVTMLVILYMCFHLFLFFFYWSLIDTQCYISVSCTT